MRTDFLKLAYIVPVLFFGSHQRPEVRDFRFTNIKETCAVRRAQPFVQARAVVIAIQILMAVWKMSERMRAVDDRLDATCARHPANLFDRKNLSGEIRDMAEMNDPGPRRNIILEELDELIR